MTEWPDAASIRACIAWNEIEQRRALKDSTDPALRVPAYATKVGSNGKEVPLTADEWRASRAKDAERYKRNTKDLKARL